MYDVGRRLRKLACYVRPLILRYTEVELHIQLLKRLDSGVPAPASFYHSRIMLPSSAAVFAEVDEPGISSTTRLPMENVHQQRKTTLLHSSISHIPPTHTRTLHDAVAAPSILQGGDLRLPSTYRNHAIPSFLLPRVASVAENFYNISSATNIVPLNANFNRAGEADNQRAPIKYQLTSPAFEDLFTPELQHVADLFKKYGFEIRIAGGAVRDILMGKVPHDVDFATNATPDQMKELFEKEIVRMINLGAAERHGTITARINDKENFEITTLRIETNNDGRWAQVQWTTDWFLDACRRDLTINAMFLGLDGILYDYFGGLEDLQARKIKFVGEPRVRLQEDFLRIMRYFRFFGRIAEKPYVHDERALQAIRTEAPGLQRISGERIWAEWQKIITQEHAVPVMEKMHELCVTQYMGLNPDINLGELSKVCLRSSSLSPLPVTLVSALLRTTEDVDQLNKRLRLSNDQRNLAYFIVQWRNSYADAVAAASSTTDGAGDAAAAAAVQFLRSLVMDSTTSEAKEQTKRQSFACELAKYVGDEQSLRDLENWEAPRFPVRTERLLDTNKITRPYMCGRAIEGLRRRWIDSGFRLSEDELLGQPLDEIIAAIKTEPPPARRGPVDKKLAKNVHRSNKRRKEDERARKLSDANESSGEDVSVQQ